MGRNKGKDPRYWIYQDPFDHVRHQAWHKARAQANFRNEGWEITIAEWFAIWPMDKWVLRGRGSNDLCMVRIDRDRPFSADNVKLVTRYWQITRDKKANQKPEKERQI
jgi:uncharacterized protein (DUF1684 family)